MPIEELHVIEELYVVGYEAGADPSYPLIWGAAAVRDKRGVFNAVIGCSPYQPRANPEEWAKLMREGSATAIEIEIPVDTLKPYFVMSVRKDLAELKPYYIDPEFAFMRKVTAIGYGEKRTYYVFDSHDAVQSWLYHMNAGKYVLVPVET